MIYKCKSCNETYPYQPVMCNECGVMFSPTTFDWKEEDLKRGIVLKTVWTTEEVKAKCRLAIEHGKQINAYQMSSLPDKYAPISENQWINDNIK